VSSRRNTVGINPRNFLPGDLVLREDLDGRNLCIFLRWCDEEVGRAFIYDHLGHRAFWFEPPQHQRSYEKWWIVGRSEEVLK